MNVFEYKVKCPHCKSVLTVAAENITPIIFNCHGCNRKVVLHNNSVYTVSEEAYSFVSKWTKTRPCGQIIGFNKSKNLKSGITEKQIEELHEILNDTNNFDDIVKKLK